MGRGSIWNKDSGLIAGWILKANPLECSVTDFEMSHGTTLVAQKANKASKLV